MRGRTRAEVAEENRNVAIMTVAIVVALFSVFFISPGMMILTFAIRPFVHLDRAQMWIFSIAASAATYAGLRFGIGGDRPHGKYYFGLCALSISAFVAAKFGFHAVWPDRMWDLFAMADVP